MEAIESLRETVRVREDHSREPIFCQRESQSKPEWSRESQGEPKSKPEGSRENQGGPERVRLKSKGKVCGKSLYLTPLLSGSNWLSLALCGSQWLSLPLSDSLWFSLAHYCSEISLIQALLSSQGPCSALRAAPTLTHFIPVWIQVHHTYQNHKPLPIVMGR